MAKLLLAGCAVTLAAGHAQVISSVQQRHQLVHFLPRKYGFNRRSFLFYLMARRI